jgi:hypothetical protein
LHHQETFSRVQSIEVNNVTRSTPIPFSSFGYERQKYLSMHHQVNRCTLTATSQRRRYKDIVESVILSVKLTMSKNRITGFYGALI